MGTLICKVELDKQKGITVTVDNADGKITQTVHMDGTAITIKVQGQSDTSTITQKADSIHIKVKEYLLEAETITQKSTKATLHQSQDTFTQKSSKAMTVETQDKLDVKATQDCSVSAMNIAMKGNQKISGTAPMGISFEASGGEAKVMGLKLALQATTTAELKGLKTDVKADTMVNVEGSAMATLKGQLAQVSGSLIKLG